MKPRLVQPLGPWPEPQRRRTAEEIREAARNRSARYHAKNREQKKAYNREYRQRQKEALRAGPRKPLEIA